MSGITTHVLDTALGQPAAGMRIVLEGRDGDGWTRLREATTNSDGRVDGKLLDEGFQPGTFRVTFHTADYHAAQGVDGFYPRVEVEFTIRDADQHYHVPLLISPFGFSTYRGS